MVQENKTEIRIETEKALRNLAKLDGKLRSTGKVAEDAFNKSGKASELFESAMGRLPAPVAKVVVGLRNLTGVTPLAAAGVVALTVAGRSLAAQLGLLPQLLRDTLAQVDALNDAIERRKGVADGLSSIADARINRALQNDLRSLQLQRAELNREQVGVQAARERAQDRIRIEREFYNQLDQRARESATVRESLQERISRIESRRASSVGAGLPPKFQLRAVLDEAARQRTGGNLDAADQLLAQARDIANQLGHSVFLRQVEAEENKLIRQLKRTESARRAEEQTINSSANASKKRVQSLEEEIRSLTKRNNALSREKTNIRAQTTETRVSAAEAKEAQDADQAVRDRNAAVAKIRNALNATRADGERLKNTLDAVVSAAFTSGSKSVRGQISLLKEGRSASEEILKDLSSGTGSGDEKAIAKFREIIKVIETARANKEEFSKAFEFDIQKLEKAANLVNSLADANARFIGADRGGQRFVEGARSNTSLEKDTAGAKDRLSEATAEAVRLQDALNKAAFNSSRINVDLLNELRGPSTPASARAGVQTNATTEVSRNSQTTIEVNADIKGNVLDGDFVDKFVDIIQRRLRQNTTPGIN